MQVLDAPALQDDFYLNLVDWSTQNVLAVGLGSCVYLWSACTSRVIKDFPFVFTAVECRYLRPFCSISLLDVERFNVIFN